MKSFTLNSDQHGKEQRFVAYLLPEEDPVQRNADEPSSSRCALVPHPAHILRLFVGSTLHPLIWHAC